VRQGALQQLGIQDGITERGAELVGRHLLDAPTVQAQRTWRRSARAPYCPHSGQARCGRCLPEHAGLAQVTSEGATAFHCDRLDRVLLRDILRFGTATYLTPWSPGVPRPVA
jgi:hypothetical protein